MEFDLKAKTKLIKCLECQRTWAPNQFSYDDGDSFDIMDSPFKIHPSLIYVGYNFGDCPFCSRTHFTLTVDFASKVNRGLVFLGNGSDGKPDVGEAIHYWASTEKLEWEVMHMSQLVDVPYYNLDKDKEEQKRSVFLNDVEWIESHFLPNFIIQSYLGSLENHAIRALEIFFEELPKATLKPF